MSTTQPQNEQGDGLEEMRRKLLNDASELESMITLEFTVGNSMDSKKKEIKDLTRQCKEEDRQIIDLEKQIALEEKKAEARANNENLLQDENTGPDNDLIVQLENELKDLYAQKAKLMKNMKK